MTEAREALINLIDELPEDEVQALLADARRRVSRPNPSTTWPPAFFGAVKRGDLPNDLARNHRKHLTEAGFGEDFRG